MRIVFMGSGDIALPSLRWLLDSPEHEVLAVVTQPDKPVGRHQVLTASAIKQAALEREIPVLQPAKVRAPEVLQSLAELAPDFIIVMAYGQILPKTLLDLPKVACLNLHASLLPRHRGASPIQAAILAGDASTGITLMHMDVGLDTGDIVISHETPISPTDTAGILHDRLADLAPEVLAEGLPLFAENRAPRTPQDPALVTASGKLDRDSGRLDWNHPANFLERHIRAMHPWPGAFTILPSGKKLKIHSASILPQTGSPGHILPTESQRLVVATGENALVLEDVQLEGRGRMKAADFLRGNPLPPGTVLS
ncbi:MAG TPA: methionyl-tRNA formyltransferase [Chthoniobacterales bacterium]|jgi:methionyl-tRNA formyltransferase